MNLQHALKLLQNIREHNGFNSAQRATALDLLQFLIRASEPLEVIGERQRCREIAANWLTPLARESQIAIDLELERAQARVQGALAERSRLLMKFKEQEQTSLSIIVSRDARIKELSDRVADRARVIERASWFRSQIMEVRDLWARMGLPGVAVKLDALLEDPKGKAL